jgi:hypothetical protein
MLAWKTVILNEKISFNFRVFNKMMHKRYCTCLVQFSQFLSNNARNLKRLLQNSSCSKRGGGGEVKTEHYFLFLLVLFYHMFW